MKTHSPSSSFATLALVLGLLNGSAPGSASRAAEPAQNSTEGRLSQAHELLQAVIAGTGTEAIQKVLDHGADINARAEAGITAYHAARVLGDLDAAQYLISHGADTNIALPAPDGIVDALFNYFIKQNTPGASVLVAQSGQVLFKKGYGLADVARGTAFSSETKSR